jgi:porin
LLRPLVNRVNCRPFDEATGLAAKLVPTTADPGEVDRVVAEPPKSPLVRSATWSGDGCLKHCGSSSYIRPFASKRDALALLWVRMIRHWKSRHAALTKRPERRAALLLHAALVGMALLPALSAAAVPTIASDTAATPEPSESIWQRDTLTGSWSGIRPRLEAAGVTLGLQEQDEVWWGISGGLRRGAAYDGLTTASVKLDLDKLVGWKDATFFVNAYQIHGNGPTKNLTGNIQLVSNIEATADTKLYQLWIEQALFDGRLSIRVGQGGVNDEMMISTNSALFLNSSFGLPGLSAVDLPSGGPSYPLATPFARIQVKPSDQVTMFAGIFNGDPAPPGTGDPQLRDKGGVAFRTNDHVLAAAELWYAINEAPDATGLPGTYKIGAWVHSGHFADQLRDTNGVSLANPASNGLPADHSPNFAVYGIMDQTIWRNPASRKQSVAAFVHVIGAPAEFNLSQLSLAAGLNWIGPFASRENDILGVAVAYLGISPVRRRFGNDVLYFTGQGAPYLANETVLEATWQIALTPWWMLQPDLQLIVNPGAGMFSTGSTKLLKQAVIGGLRTMITF